MRSLKHIRIAVSIIFLLECAAFVVFSMLGRPVPVHSHVARYVQIVPSMLATSFGTTLVWLAVTLFFGRLYCSSVCPLGTMQDVAIHLRQKIKPKPFRSQHRRKLQYSILLVYIVCVVAGVGVIPLVAEPWPAFANIITSLSGHGVPVEMSNIVGGVLTGVVCGVLSAVLLAVYSLWRGRDFCNEVCPVGTVLAVTSAKAVMHIELEPDKCTACMKCEDVCKASCINIATRQIDNSRCVRCFNCINVCPDDAIHYQYNRNNIFTPMMRRTTEPGMN